MITHHISFRYSGRMAAVGAMDAGHVERAAVGARIVLASHCHFVCKGRVPKRVTSKTRDFRVVAFASQQGSLDLQYAVVIGSAMLSGAQLLKPFFAGILEEAGKDTYKIVLRRHSIAWLKRLASREGLTTHEKTDLSHRIEPELPWPHHEYVQADPVSLGFDNYAASGLARDPNAEYRKLLAQTDLGMTMSAAPIGRDGGSSSLEVRIDGEFVGYVGERDPRKDHRLECETIRRIADEINRVKHQQR